MNPHGFNTIPEERHLIYVLYLSVALDSCYSLGTLSLSRLVLTSSAFLIQEALPYLLAFDCFHCPHLNLH